MENEKLNYKELVNRQIETLVLGNSLMEDLMSISEDYEIYYTKDTEVDIEEDYYPEFYQYFLIGDDEYWIKKIIDNGTLDIMRISTQNDDYYFLCVGHYGTSWDYIYTDFTEEDL